MDLMIWWGMQNFEYLDLLDVLAFRSKKSLSDHFFHGQTCMESLVLNQKRCCQKVIEFIWIYPKVICMQELPWLLSITKSHYHRFRG